MKQLLSSTVVDNQILPFKTRNNTSKQQYHCSFVPSFELLMRYLGHLCAFLPWTICGNLVNTVTHYVQTTIELMVHITWQIRNHASWETHSKLCAIGCHQRCRDSVVIFTNASFSTCSVTNGRVSRRKQNIMENGDANLFR